MKTRKKGLIILIIVLVLIGVGFAVKKYMWLNCPHAQFEVYCEGSSCTYAQKRLSEDEKKAFVAIRKYQKETGKDKLDNDVLKIVSKESLAEIALKMRAAAADEVRQAFLDNMPARDKFPGNYDCMRQTYTNHLSNEEVLFLNELKGKDLNALQNPVVRQMYLTTSSKVMRCMNEAVQKQYLEEVKLLTAPQTPAEEKKPAPKKKKVKKEAPKEEPKKEE